MQVTDHVRTVPRWRQHCHNRLSGATPRRTQSLVDGVQPASHATTGTGIANKVLAPATPADRSAAMSAKQVSVRFV